MISLNGCLSPHELYRTTSTSLWEMQTLEEGILSYLYILKGKYGVDSVSLAGICYRMEHHLRAVKPAMVVLVARGFLNIHHQGDEASYAIHRVAQSFELNEEWLQKYLASHPEILPLRDLDGIDSPLRLLARELIGIDLLFANEKGLLTVVETKLVQNPELRRKVVL